MVRRERRGHKGGAGGRGEAERHQRGEQGRHVESLSLIFVRRRISHREFFSPGPRALSEGSRASRLCARAPIRCESFVSPPFLPFAPPRFPGFPPPSSPGYPDAFGRARLGTHTHTHLCLSFFLYFPRASCPSGTL